jgi:phosphocarrier protein HPr
MSERTVTIASRVGLHARPAAVFAAAVAALPIEVTIGLASDPVEDAIDASSILSLMSLGAANGDDVILRAEGEGADEALEALVTLLETDLDAE